MIPGRGKDDKPENLPILYQNIMLGLRSNQAKAAFLWAVEQPGECRACYRAEAFARDVDDLVAQITMIERSARILQEQKPYLDADVARVSSGVLAFILRRHANWRFGGNVAPSYTGMP